MEFLRQPKEFEYFAPASLEEASRLYLTYGEKACILAGGTDVVPSMKRGELTPQYIIDINKIPDMSYIRVEDSMLKIGALTTVESIRKSPLIEKYYRALHMAAETIGSTIIRNIATIGGNICNFSPAADMVPPLIILGAKLKVFSPQGVSITPIEDFFLRSQKSILSVGEILYEIEVPPPPNKQAFLKLTRTRNDLAMINISTAFNLSDGRCAGIRIALGKVAQKVFRAERTESFLEGKELSDETIEEAMQIINKEVTPHSGRTTADYRQEMSKVLLRRVMKLALD